MKYLLVIMLLTGCADKLYSVNKRINSYQYIPHGAAKDFYKNGGGDCKAFAVIKYQELLKDGYDMKFVIIPKEKTTGLAHAVLEVDGLILDNMNDKLNRASSVKGYRVNYETMQLIARK